MADRTLRAVDTAARSGECSPRAVRSPGPGVAPLRSCRMSRMSPPS